MANACVVSLPSHQPVVMVTTASAEPENPNHNMPPSRVIHCRAVALGCQEIDLINVMKLFGNVKALKLIPKSSQALVEFEILESAIACVTYSRIQPIMVHGRRMYVNYSKSSEIVQKEPKIPLNQENLPTNVVLLTIVNVMYQVNVDTIKTICRQQNAEPQRIVIFHKNGLQALVEFSSISDAIHILQALNGCDIYPGCCNLKIEYSRIEKLNVRANSTELYNIDIPEWTTANPQQYSQEQYQQMGQNYNGYQNMDPSTLAQAGQYDQTQLNYAAQSQQNHATQGQPNYATQGQPFETQAQPTYATQGQPTYAMPAQSAYAAAPQPNYAAPVVQPNYAGYPNYTMPSYPNYTSFATPGQPNYTTPGVPTYSTQTQPNYLDQYTSPFTDLNVGAGVTGGGDGCVAMVHGINNSLMNCEHMFNLFCLYGNVVRVKILENNTGQGLVQYADRLSTEMAIQYLNNLSLFGETFQVSFSKSAFINDAPQVSPLFDNSPNTVKFQDSRNNRFKPVPGGRNDLFSRIHPPSKVLHYFNAPPDCSEERVIQLFESFKAEIPRKQLAVSKPGSKSSSGLVEFSSISAAVEALILVNHVTLRKTLETIEVGDKAGAPYTFKLAFSTSESINKRGH